MSDVIACLKCGAHLAEPSIVAPIDAICTTLELAVLASRDALPALQHPMRDELRLRRTDDPLVALQWTEHPLLTAFVVDASAGAGIVTQLGYRLAAAGSNAPIIYVGATHALLADGGALVPDLVLPVLEDVDGLRRKILDLLRWSDNARFVAAAARRSCVEVLSEGFLVDPRLEGVCFRGWARPLSEVNATIPLCGPTISGRLSASVAPEVARRIYQRMLPTEPEPSERTLQDLVGEMCNQVLGGLKRALARHGVDFAVGVPMMWSGTGCPARYRSLAGSTLLTVADRDTQDRVRVDLTLDSLVGEYVQATDGVECATGELAFL